MSVLNTPAAYQTLPIVMVAFFKDNGAFVSDILLRISETAHDLHSAMIGKLSSITF